MAMLQGLQNNLARYFNFDPAEAYDVSDETESMKDYIARVRAEGGTLSFSNLPGKGYDTHTIREKPISQPAGMTPELVQSAVQNTGVDPYQPFDYNTGTEQEFVDSQIRKREVAGGLQNELMLQRQKDLNRSKLGQAQPKFDPQRFAIKGVDSIMKQMEIYGKMLENPAMSEEDRAKVTTTMDTLRQQLNSILFQKQGVAKKGPPPKSVTEVVGKPGGKPHQRPSALKNELSGYSSEDFDYGATGLYQDPLYRLGSKIPDYLKRLYEQFDVPIGSIGMQ